MAYKKLIKVSNVCQLLDKRKYNSSYTINGVTFTNNGDGTITVNGTATDRTLYRIYDARYLPSTSIGHKCLIESNVSLPGGYTIILHSANWAYSSDKPIGKIDEASVSNIYISVFPGYTANNLVFKPQLFDLTEMYGAGHEPTSVEQFRQDFPEEMYDYSPNCWLTSYKRVFMTGGGNYLTSYQRNLTCKTKNLWTCNKTYNFYTYDKSTQVFTIFGTGLGSCYTLPTPISAGETFTISVYCLSGEIPSESTVVIGGYHFGEKSIWQTEVTLPVGNVGGKVYYRTATTTDTLTDFLIFVYQSGPTNLKVRIQFERGSTATDYVPYGHL